MKENFGDDGVNATRFAVLLVRTKRAGTESFLTEARQAIWSVNANLPVFRVRTLKDLYDQSMARTSFTLVMLAIAGGMALLLGIVGIYASLPTPSRSGHVRSASASLWARRAPSCVKCSCAKARCCRQSARR